MCVVIFPIHYIQTIEIEDKLKKIQVITSETNCVEQQLWHSKIEPKFSQYYAKHMVFI